MQTSFKHEFFLEHGEVKGNNVTWQCLINGQCPGELI